VLNRLGSHYDSNDQLPEAIDYFKQQAALPGIEPKARAGLYTNIAGRLERLEQWEEAIESHRRALAIYVAQGDRGSQANTLVYIGDAQVRRNQLAQSLESFKQAAALEPARNYKALQANALLRRGEAEENKKQLPQALESYRQALALFKEINPAPQSPEADSQRDAEQKIQNLTKSLQSPPPQQ
jgi:tetratricopeptide (TPR) repeat protein